MPESLESSLGVWCVVPPEVVTTFATEGDLFSWCEDGFAKCKQCELELVKFVLCEL